MTYTSLADFAQTWAKAEPGSPPAFAFTGHGAPLPSMPMALRERLEEVLDTVVALQRAEWLQDGLYVGPRAMPHIYRDLLDASRQLEVAVPAAVIGSSGAGAQGVFGTNDRPFLHLSSLFFQAASEGERRFVMGRLCGHAAADQVTWLTLYALLVDHNGLRRLARRHLGPTLEVVLAPLSLGMRVALSRWHREAEASADRAGLLVAGDLEAATTAMMRVALGTKPAVSAAEYLEQLRRHGGDGPGKWTELLADQPFLHKRLQALERFERSELYASLGGTPPEGPRLDDAALEQQTAAILQVS